MTATKPETVRLKDKYSGGDVWLTVRDGYVVGCMGSDPARYVGMQIAVAKRYARYGGNPDNLKSPGGRVITDLEKWGVDRALIDEVRHAFRAGETSRAYDLARDLGWNRASKRGRGGQYP